MQKLISLYKPSQSELNNLNIKYLDDGWKVKDMTSNNDHLILLLEKETRKEKLDELDIISKS